MNAIWGSVCGPALSLCVFSLLFSSSSFAQAVTRVVPPVDNSQRVTLSGNVHPLARAEFDRGAVDNSLPLPRILLLLKRSDAQEAALQTYLEQQQDKSSANYHAWLTPAQFGELYGPADSDVQAVMQWLTSQGFTINKVYSGKTVIEFSGNAGQVQAAFGAVMHNFAVNSKAYVANANDPQIPAALAPVVAGIVSLNNFPRQSHLRITGQARKIAGKPGLQPLFTFPVSGQSTDFYGVGPADFATIYNSQSLITAGNNGSGQTIAVVGETDINVADVQAFRQEFGLPANFTTSNVILNGEDPGITSLGEETEADLDVQWSGAVAPGATIDYVVSESTPVSAGIDLSALYIIEYNLAGVMSESYGACESDLGATGNAFYNSMWEQAAAQGITVILSAGDGGSAGCDDFDTATTAQYGLAVSGMASTPFNVAVGGTDFDDVNKWSTYWSASNNSTTGESALSYIPEIPWNQNCAQISLTGCTTNPPSGSLNIVAGGGGASTYYSKPSWQIGVTGMPNDSHRDLPDLSLFASPGFDDSGYIICAGDGTTITGPSQCNAVAGEFVATIVGGTSASAPSFAGVMALVNQKESSTQTPASRQGNANQVLYALVKKSGASCTSGANEAATCIFNDITHGNSTLPTGAAGVGTNSVPCQGGTPNCSEVASTENGVLVEPTNAQIEAYTVNAGYDLVTGLGSVNIGNLATNWGTVNTVPTTTTLTLSPTTGITHGTGEDVTVNITVTPTTGTATGDVSLIATIAGPNGATTQGLNLFTLSAGKVVNGTTNSLPGGTSYQVYAHYAGDGTNAPSDSTPVTVTVGQETSQTFIVVPTYNANGNPVSGNASSVAYGSLYILTMYVTDKNAVASASGPPTPACYQENILTCPTGTVSLTDGGNPLGTGRGGSGSYYLNSAGHTENLNLSLTGGTHTLVATYSGDNSYQGSTSATTTFTVTPAPMTLSFQAPVNPVAGIPAAATVSGTAAAPGGGVAPTGTITIYDGTNVLGSPLTVAGNAGTSPGFGLDFGLTVLTGGNHTFTAQYSGDTNYAGATSAAQSVHVLYATTLNVQTSTTSVPYGTSVTITATISTGQKSPAITGQIAFTGSTLDTINTSATTQGTDANGNLVLQATATLVPQTSEAINVSYPGDSNYASSVGASAYITVNIPDFGLSPSSGLTVVATAGQTGSGQITITPTTQTPSTVNLAVVPLSGSVSSLIIGYSIGFSPQQVSLNGSAVTSTLSLTPNSSAPANVIRRQAKRGGVFLWPSSNSRPWGVAIVCLLLFALFSARSRHYKNALALTMVGLLLAFGCGGGSGSGGGNGGGGGGGSTLPTTVTMTTSSAKVDQNSPFTLTVNVNGNPAPNGSAVLYDYGSALSITAIPVTAGTGQITIEGYNVGIGVHQLTATFTGSDVPQITSSPLTQTVTGTVPVLIQGSTGGDTHTISATIGLQ